MDAYADPLQALFVSDPFNQQIANDGEEAQGQIRQKRLSDQGIHKQRGVFDRSGCRTRCVKQSLGKNIF
jgi:hypothetical protein